MDNRIVGKWKQTLGDGDDRTIVNIFDKEPPQIKLTNLSTGYFNVDPNCTYEKDGFVCWEINDEYYRMVYHVRIEDGILKGYYTQFGNETKVEFEKMSDIPEDGEFEHSPEKALVPGYDITRLDALKDSVYSTEIPEDSINPEFRLCEQIPEIAEKYGFSKYTEGISEDDDRIAFAVLDFVCDHFRHNGQNGTGGKSVEQIIKFCENNNGKTNCRGLSIMLASLLRMKGIKAAHVTCMPYEDPFNDCHVVVDCILPSGKRVMLDPTYRLYLRDKNGEYVSLRHLREMLISGEEYVPNDKAGYNGGEFNLAEQRIYMTKNTFRFSRCKLNADGYDEHDSRSPELIPANYPTQTIKDRRSAVYITNDELFWSYD